MKLKFHTIEILDEVKRCLVTEEMALDQIYVDLPPMNSKIQTGTAVKRRGEKEK